MENKINTPYPEIKVTALNEAYGLMMLDNVGGMNSETSAICQYIYNQSIINEEFHKLKKLFLDISMAEMHHLNIFMSLAMKLGVDPRWWSCLNDQCTYWSPSYLNYPTDLNELLKSAINSEYQAIAKYMEQVKTIDDPYIEAILLRIIADEQRHIKMLKEWESKLVR